MNVLLWPKCSAEIKPACSHFDPSAETLNNGLSVKLKKDKVGCFPLLLFPSKTPFFYCVRPTCSPSVRRLLHQCINATKIRLQKGTLEK